MVNYIECITRKACQYLLVAAALFPSYSLPQAQQRVVVIPLIESAPMPEPKRVFVSSSQHTGNLGGVFGANTICQNLADNAGLQGTFRAWLSTGGSISRYSPDRFFIKHSLPYVNMQGQTLAENWDDLTDGSIENPVRYTETGASAGTQTATMQRVWTYTQVDGTSKILGPNALNFSSCSGWIDNRAVGTGHHGNFRTSNSVWTNGSTVTCNNFSRLYCVEQ